MGIRRWNRVGCGDGAGDDDGHGVVMMGDRLGIWRKGWGRDIGYTTHQIYHLPLEQCFMLLGFYCFYSSFWNSTAILLIETPALYPTALMRSEHALYKNNFYATR